MMRPLMQSTLVRGVRPFGCVVGAVSLAFAALATSSASPAAATAPPPKTILETGPLAATVVVGQPYSAYLAVEGNTGRVTYTQKSGAPNITVSSKGLIDAPNSLAAGTYNAGGTDADQGSGRGDWSFTLTVVPQAPGDFAGTALHVYQSVYDFDQSRGQGAGLQTPSDYQTQLSKLSPNDLATFYSEVSQVPEWFQIPGIMESATASTGTLARLQSLAKGSATATPAKLQTHAKAPASATAADESNPVAPYAPDGTGNGYDDPSCGQAISASDSIVFGLQVVIDAANSVYDLATLNIPEAESSAVAPASLPAVSGLVVIAAIADLVLLAASVAHDTISYLSLAPSECQQNDVVGYVANIDNSTVQTYNLLTTAVDAVAQVQSSVTTTDQDVQALASQLGTVQTSLGSAIAQNAHAIQVTVGGDSQGVLSQLQTDNGALQQDLSTINNDFGDVHTHLAAVDSDMRDQIQGQGLNIIGSLTNDTQQVLQAQSAKYDALSQDISALNTKVGDDHAEQITLQIENALVSTAPVAPTELLTPGPQGGLLTTPNKWNTSVKDLVEANTTCPAGDTDLAANNFKQAFKDFRTCYQAVAGLP
jgi:hypothetical protein